MVICKLRNLWNILISLLAFALCHTPVPYPCAVRLCLPLCLPLSSTLLPYLCALSLCHIAPLVSSRSPQRGISLWLTSGSSAGPPGFWPAGPTWSLPWVSLSPPAWDTGTGWWRFPCGPCTSWPLTWLSLSPSPWCTSGGWWLAWSGYWPDQLYGFICINNLLCDFMLIYL